MTSRFRALAGALLLGAALAPALLADSPRTIPFQGVLQDGSGKAKPDGSYTVTFRLYDPTLGTSTATQEPHTYSASTIVLNQKPVVPNSVTMIKSDGSITYTPNTAYTVDYQNGIITRVSAATIPDGTAVKVTYQYTGTMLWEETKAVTVAKGLFVTQLGSATFIPASIVFDRPYNIEVQVQGEASPMSPKLALGAVPYALRASGLQLPFVSSVDDSFAALSIRNSGSGSVLRGQSAGIGSVLFGESTGTYSDSGDGVEGVAHSAGNSGVYGRNDAPHGIAVHGWASGENAIAVLAQGPGISSTGVWADGGRFGVDGGSAEGIGVYGRSGMSYGVVGEGFGADAAIYGNHIGSDAAPGVEGHSESFNGIIGYSMATGHAGVAGVSDAPGVGNGVYGRSDNGGSGVFGTSATGVGVYGESPSNGSGAGNHGVLGRGTVPQRAGVWGENNAPSAWGVFGSSAGAGSAGVQGVANGGTSSVGVYGASVSGTGVTGASTGSGSLFIGYNGLQNVFRVDRAGKVFANGNFQAGGADVAEFIASSDNPQPGDVVEIDPDTDGHFRKSRTANSTRVAGVISTLPGVTMGAERPALAEGSGPQLALVGRVPVHATAEKGPIRRGDLLASSSRPGYVMRAPDYPKAGTIVGKALSSLAEGTGIVEMLVMLR